MNTQELELQSIKVNTDRPTDGDWAEVLAGIPLFTGVPKRHLRALARSAKTAEYGRGDIVIVTGERDDGLYVILSGRAKVIGRSTTRLLAQGDYFGELAMIDGEPRSATVVAARDLHVMRVSQRALMELMERQPDIAVTMLKVLSERLRRVEKAKPGPAEPDGWPIPGVA
jgi:CRP/FNR family cyclic AMP-dependent transcriptional regulator